MKAFKNWYELHQRCSQHDSTYDIAEEAWKAALEWALHNTVKGCFINLSVWKNKNPQNEKYIIMPKIIEEELEEINNEQA